jgi:hypothetical protein
MYARGGAASPENASPVRTDGKSIAEGASKLGAGANEMMMRTRKWNTGVVGRGANLLPRGQQIYAFVTPGGVPTPTPMPRATPRSRPTPPPRRGLVARFGGAQAASLFFSAACRKALRRDSRVKCPCKAPGLSLASCRRLQASSLCSPDSRDGIAKSKQDSVVWRVLHCGAWDLILYLRFAFWDLEPAAARTETA